jgi:hypothetical protein
MIVGWLPAVPITKDHTTGEILAILPLPSY